MTPADLMAFAQARHGARWMRPLAAETGYSVSHLWRIAREGRPVSGRLARAVGLLRPKSKPRRRPLPTPPR